MRDAVAIVGIALATVLGAKLFADLYVSSGENHRQVHDAQKHNAASGNHNPASVRVARQDKGSATYQPVCDRPQSREEYDSCEQTRMAGMAEAQYWLSVAGLVGLVFTVFFAAIAAGGALRTAKTAQRQFSSDHRPWVFFTGINIVSDIDIGEEEATLALRFQFKNAGRSPALRVRILLTSWNRNEEEREGEIRLQRIMDLSRSGFGLGRLIAPEADGFETWAISVPREAFVDEAGGICLFPVVTAIIGYEFSYEEGIHVTRETVEVGVEGGEINRSRGRVRVEDLIVSRQFRISGYAD